MRFSNGLRCKLEGNRSSPIILADFQATKTAPSPYRVGFP